MALLLSESTLTSLLQTVVDVAAGALPSMTGASLTMLTDGEGRFETTNASSDRIRAVDECQYMAADGPCVQAIRMGAEVKATIPASAWPAFSAAAQEASIRSVWSLPLAFHERTAASLNLYFNVESPWETSMAEPARLLVRQADAILHNGMALAHTEHVNVTLRRALETRTVIGQAQGVLMARQAIPADAAFDILRRASQRTNRKLRDVATEIVAGVGQGRNRQ